MSTSKIHTTSGSQMPDIYKRFGGSASKAELLSRAAKDVNLPVWSMKNIMYLLNSAYNDKSRSFLVLGAAGIGKSAVMKQFAQAAASRESRTYVKFNSLAGLNRSEAIKDPSQYYVFLDLRAGELNPEQVQGIPDVDYGKQHGYLRFLPPDWVKLVSNPKFSGMLFLDELNRSDKNILNSLLQLSLDREISGHTLSKNAMVCAAANWGAEFEGNVQELDTAHMRRFKAGVLVLKPVEWEEYAMNMGISKYIIDFAMSNPSDNMFGKGKEINKDIPINPASLEFASNSLKEVERQYHDHWTSNTPLPAGSTGDIYQDLSVALSGDLGEEWVNKFVEWLRIVHKFNWNDIVNKAKEGAFKTKSKEFGASEKFALTSYITDQTYSRWLKARENKNLAEKQKAIDTLNKQLATILTGVDNDQASMIAKVIKHQMLKDIPSDMDELDADLLAAERWYEFIIPLLKSVKEEHPEEVGTFVKVFKAMKSAKDSAKDSTEGK